MTRLRTFIAVPIDAAIRQHAVALQHDLAKCRCDVKWVEADTLHVTLLFLGEVDVRDTPGVCRSVVDATAETTAFSLRIAGVGCFPNMRRPRTIWIGIEDGSAELIRVHDAIETLLLQQGAYRREDRSFTPHITLGRIKSDGDARLLSQAMASHREWCGGVQTVREIQILSSELTPDGPIYTVLGRAKLRSVSGLES